jgi:uncharacterized protein (TIGR02147 family)
VSKNIKISSTSVSPTHFVDYKLFLLALYEFMKSHASHYSYKQMAEDLGFAPTGIINQMVSGRRRLTSKSAQTISVSLGLAGVEKRYFLTLVDYTHAKDSTRRQELHSKLVELKSQELQEDEKDALAYFSRWFHPVIREILGMEHGSADPEWIAEKIFPKVRVQEVEASIALMVRLGLLIFDDEKKRLVPSEKSIRTPRATKSIALKHYHEETIELGKASLAQTPGQDRNISTIATSMSQKTFSKVKQQIVDFQLKILSECEEENDQGDRVFQFNMQLFPVTTPTQKKGK